MRSKLPLVWHFLFGSFFLAITCGAQPITRIAAGNNHTLFVRSDGSLWATGFNVYGALGDGTYNIAIVPKLIVSNNVTEIAAGDGFSFFLKNDGSLWGMGENYAGQLGNGTNYQTNRPQMIVSSNVTAISTKRQHCLFIKGDGSLWAMGRNDDGQFGDGTTSFTNRPKMIVESNVTAIAAGAAHSLFLKSDGSLWGMGANNDGQLCDGTYAHHVSRFQMANGVKAIAAGYYHTLFLKTNGSLWAAGDNNYGEIGNHQFNTPGINTPLEIVASNVVAVAAGSFNSFFIMNDGSLWATGQNDTGQLGDGQFNDVYPHAGTNVPQRILASNVVAAAPGYRHTLLIRSDGSLWGMGSNHGGTLGMGNAFSITNLPVEILSVPIGYNRITAQLISGGKMAFAYVGNANGKYALDRSFNLIPPNWIPQLTNTANSSGTLTFTNSIVLNSNNFWRVRSAP